MNAVEIVPIAPDHIESFYRALDFVARERRYLSFLEAPPLEETRAFVLDMIKRGYPQWVALSAGEVVGWCDVTPKTRPIYAHGGVLGIALLPLFRGQGIGKRLILRTLDAARAFGLRRVELTVRENNASAIELYRKVGFEIEGLQRHAVHVDGAAENVVCMALLF
ncbi:GNAT family N-acetyltransferase [Bradyrhizobium sp. S69]|uniref:GNAT family N-acetyltransferase n=1 Tax=Bradyrhizobium sp. S69 TaxID=1641856 RepID=UPI00131DC133|nr:GNAT family N-acetyltransferase [Bradyrhizobium sp. S69]